MAYIEFKNVNKTYQMGEIEIKALNKTSFEIEKGELVVILGPSGAGKTTCLNILGGMDTVTGGKVFVDGKDITKYKDKDLILYRRNNIGFVFQFYNLVQNLTALENVELAVQLCKDHLDPKTILNKVGLKNRIDNFPSQLSGGEQQRVAIARALANEPNIILADEPTGNLDKKNEHMIFEELKNLSLAGKLVIVVSHSDEIKKYADIILELKDGELSV